MSTYANPRPASLGLQLPDRYRVRRHIATGGMASVWCAEDRRSERTRRDQGARRALRPRRARRSGGSSARHARPPACRRHPHVVTIFDIGDIDARRRTAPPSAFIVMEYLPGGTVADALRCDDGDPRRRAIAGCARPARRSTTPMSAGSSTATSSRRTSCSTASACLHVADFGIARLQSEDTITSSGELFGTAAYLSPEQALGREATERQRPVLARGRGVRAADRRPSVHGHPLRRPGAPAHRGRAAAASEREPTLPTGRRRRACRRAMAKDHEGATRPPTRSSTRSRQRSTSRPTAATTRPAGDARPGRERRPALRAGRTSRGGPDRRIAAPIRLSRARQRRVARARRARRGRRRDLAASRRLEHRARRARRTARP